MESKINFDVDTMAVLCNIMNAEIRARMNSKNHPERKKAYIEMGVIDTCASINKFMKKYANIFGNKKYIKSKTNIFEEMLPVSSKNGKYVYLKEIIRNFEYTYDLSDEERGEINKFLLDFWDLSENADVQEIIKKTNEYKKSIEKIWNANSKFALSCVKEILGYDPEVIGTVCTYIMYPNYNVHRACQAKLNQTNLFFGKIKEKNPDKIVAVLTHQVVHQPMLPYKNSMTKKEKEVYHAFIKFLTDKEVYSRLSGKSSLDIVTHNENGEAMAKVYPYWLGYRFRNAEKEGKDAVKEIEKIIQIDKKYFDKLPEDSKKRQLYSGYEFDKLDAKKIVKFFKERKGINPYEFAKIDFDNREYVTK